MNIREGIVDDPHFYCLGHFYFILCKQNDQFPLYSKGYSRGTSAQSISHNKCTCYDITDFILCRNTVYIGLLHSVLYCNRKIEAMRIFSSLFILSSGYSQEAPIIINRMKRTTINANPPPWNPVPDTQFSPFLNGKAVVCIRCYPLLKPRCSNNNQ